MYKNGDFVKETWSFVTRRTLIDNVQTQVNFPTKDAGLLFIDRIKNNEVKFIFPDVLYGGMSDG